METKEFMNKIEELKQDIKVQLKQVTNQGRINAKLYDVSFVGKDKAFDGEYSPFYEFCRNEWDFFTEFLNENGLETKQYARTSSFYIVSNDYSDVRNFIDYNNLSEVSESVLEKAVIDFMDNHLYYEQRNDKDLSFNDVDYLIGYFMNQYELTLEESFDYIQESVIDSIDDELSELEEYIKTLEAVNEGYDYLNQFKENQVYNFISYIQDELENGYLDGFLVDYIDLETVKEKYPEQYDMFLKDTGFTNEQLLNEPQVAQLTEELEDVRNELKELEAKLNQDSINVAHDLIKGATPYEAIARLTQLVDIFQQKQSELIVAENELMNQLLELKGTN
jgi:hypothetical protein